MGAINYGHNEVINVGLNLNIVDLDEYDDMEKLDFWDYLNYYIEDNIPDLHYYTIVLEPGYYDGCYLRIEWNDLIYDYSDKIECNKELTNIKKFLISLLDYDFCVYTPGWLTSYYDNKVSKMMIKDAIKKQREVVKRDETFVQYCNRIYK